MDRIKLNELLKTEDDHIQKLNSIVMKAIEEEKLLSEKLIEFEDTNPPFTSRVADRVASFGGSWKFITLFIMTLTVWIAINGWLLSRPFDAFPFILLNLLLSMLAAIQAPVILMSQNRKEEKDRQRAVNDYLINLKAEIEIKNLNKKIDLLMAEQMKTLFDIQKAQMDMMEDIKQVISKPDAGHPDLKTTGVIVPV